ncbi:MAG: SRPBCC family protein [Acidimicrobiia bacterium]
MTETSDTETVERVIPAPAEAIFALLADPSRHHDIDGSGSVRDAKNSPRRVKLGDTFGMSMKLGIPYSMVSEVVDFEDNRCIAWQSRLPGILGKLSGGRIWRYDLEPVEGGTRVRETWDISKEQGTKMFLRGDKVHQHTREAMERTLENIEKLLANT